MFMDAPGGEVGRDAEEGLGQFLDAGFAEAFAQHCAGLFAAHQRDQGQGVIVQRVGGDKARPHPLGQFLHVPFLGQARRDDGAHGGAAQLVERHARFRQRLDDADMGKAARAAPRQHQPHRAPGNETGQALNVIGVAGADVMMRFKKTGADGELPRQARVGGAMQQQQLRQAAGALLKGRQIQRPLRQGPLRAREQEDAIGLAQALMRPGAVGRVAAIEHDIMRRFKRVEPFGVLLGRAHIQHRSAHAHFAQRIGQAIGNGRIRHVVLQGHDGKGLGPRIAGIVAGGGLEPSHQHLHQIQHHLGMARGQCLEALRADAQQFGVAQRHQLRGMIIVARDQRHLAHGLARRDMGDLLALPVHVGNENTQRTRHHQEQRGIVLAFPVQQGAARQAEPVGFRQEVFQRAFAHIRQQRKIGQPLAQFFRVNGLLADAEGRKERHGHACITKRSSRHPRRCSPRSQSLRPGMPGTAAVRLFPRACRCGPAWCGRPAWPRRPHRPALPGKARG